MGRVLVLKRSLLAEIDFSLFRMVCLRLKLGVKGHLLKTHTRPSQVRCLAQPLGSQLCGIPCIKGLFFQPRIANGTAALRYSGFFPLSRRGSQPGFPPAVVLAEACGALQCTRARLCKVLSPTPTAVTELVLLNHGKREVFPLLLHKGEAFKRKKKKPC